MCHVSAGKSVTPMNSPCGCECSCPVMVPVTEEIRSLEDHKKVLKDQLEAIDKKIAALKSITES